MYFHTWWIAAGLDTMQCQMRSTSRIGVGLLDSLLIQALAAKFSIFRRHTRDEEAYHDVDLRLA